jgi:hypothetical protein
MNSVDDDGIASTDRFKAFAEQTENDLASLHHWPSGHVWTRYRNACRDLADAWLRVAMYPRVRPASGDAGQCRAAG